MMLNMVEMFKAMERERQLKELEKQKEEELAERIASKVVEKLKEMNNAR